MTLPPTKARLLAQSDHNGVLVSATTDHLWWKWGESWQSIGWWEIEQAIWRAEEEVLHVISQRSEEVPLLPLSAESPVPEVVHERVMASIVAQAELEIGSGVLVTFRRAPGRVALQVRWRNPADNQRAELHDRLRTQVRQVAADLGVGYDPAADPT